MVYSIIIYIKGRLIKAGRGNSIGSGNAIVLLSAITDPHLLCKCDDQHRKSHSTPHFNLRLLS